jgi:S1-C subfamily serine protease
LQGEGTRHEAQAVWFDSRNDIALLRVPGLAGAPGLELDVNEDPGTAAAILGFPGNGPYDVQPGRLGATESILTDDAYGRGPVERRVTTLRGLVRSGNSGGPMVDGEGQVVTTIFAATVGSGARSGFGVPDSIVGDALARASGPVGTGACAH